MSVKCKDCGYLAVQCDTTRQWIEASRDFRNTGFIEWESFARTGQWEDPSSLAGRRIYREEPACFRGKADFVAELELFGHGRIPGEEERCKVFDKERDCDGFRRWQLGFTPKEHLEMDLLEKQRDWQQREAQLQRDWQVAQEAKADSRHRQHLQVAALAAVVGAMIAGAFTLLGLALSNR